MSVPTIRERRDEGEFIGLVTEDGQKLKLDYPRVFKAFYQRFAGHEVVLTLRKRRSKRSDQQNKYWWGVVVPLIAEHCGYTRDEMHEALKAKFLGQEDLTHGLRRIGSTAKLNTQEFAELTDQVIVWAASELGVVIPSPEREPTKQTARRKQAA